jgi:YD repeat-containing protein
MEEMMKRMLLIGVAGLAACSDSGSAGPSDDLVLVPSVSFVEPRLVPGLDTPDLDGQLSCLTRYDFPPPLADLECTNEVIHDGELRRIVTRCPAHPVRHLALHERTFDAASRILEERRELHPGARPQWSVTRYSYDVGGQLDRVTTDSSDDDGDASYQVTARDAAGRAIAAHVSQADLDINGVHPGTGEREVTKAHDGHGRLVREEHRFAFSDRPFLTYDVTYDDAARERSWHTHFDPSELGVTGGTGDFDHVDVFDSAGRIVESLAVGQRAETFGYDASGRLLTHTLDELGSGGIHYVAHEVYGCP